MNRQSTLQGYDPSTIEPRWQQRWAKARLAELDTDASDRGKTYVLEMFPYPSGRMHIGHVKNYSVGDVVALHRRRLGENVLHPMGYDSFGLPAENAAIKSGGHPREVTESNISGIDDDFAHMGWLLDWTRRVATHQPDYYRHTQHIFLQLFEQGLAYRKEGLVNWCPNDQTVLANEQVVDGTCERCGAEVEKKSLEQWYFRITDYAQRLLDDIDKLEDWPERVTTMQRNWIGRSVGAEIVFHCEELDLDIPVFTTRADTLWGATFFVLAPEHPLVPVLVGGTEYADKVMAYVEESKRRSQIERQDAGREKTGVPTGRFVTNPANGHRIPVFVADYVLPEYGTGALMAVPAHDARDFEFAQRFDIPVRQVVTCQNGSTADMSGDGHRTGEDLPLDSRDGRLINSMQFSGLGVAQAQEQIVAWLEQEGCGTGTVNYRLRDWLISRQRYWGCPIPIVYCDSCGVVAVPVEQLPVELPEVSNYTPEGESPLATAAEWVNTSCPQCDGPARRETDTMDTFVDSSWYFLRFCDPHNEDRPFSREAADRWMPVDQYIGGVEHAILHLLYARFVTKALHDAGWLSVDEPFRNLFTQGMVCKDGAKMSKSRGNIVEPLPYVEKYGADALRLYVLFVGPPDQDVEWQDNGIEGTRRFLERLWRIAQAVEEEWRARGGAATPSTSPSAAEASTSATAREAARAAHEAIAKVGHDISRGFQFNTAIAQLMEALNVGSRIVNAGGAGALDEASLGAVRFLVGTIASLLHPFAPHAACELWDQQGGAELWREPWPVADPEHLVQETQTIVVQVNGKLRDRIEVPVAADQAEVLAAARSADNAAAHLDGKEIAKEVVVPGRLVNFVVR